MAIWARDGEVVNAINTAHRSDGFLPGHGLAPTLRATTDLAQAVRKADVVLNAVPSHATRAVLEAAHADHLRSAILVNSSKGIELGTLTFLSGVVEGDAAGQPVRHAFGTELRRGGREPAADGGGGGLARRRPPPEQAQALFATPFFRVYTSDDVIGVEVGGAIKNVMAIAAGVLDGLGLGHNPRAALLTRGLAEMTRLGVALGR